jgi:hypothetical protein
MLQNDDGAPEKATNPNTAPGIKSASAINSKASAKRETVFSTTI